VEDLITGGYTNEYPWNIIAKIWIVFSGLVTLILFLPITRNLGINQAEREYEREKKKTV